MKTVSIGRVMWPGYVGIGAGLAKNGRMLLDYGAVASSVEIGSITRHLREGNPGQTVWKYLDEKSLRHNAGMPNYGIEHLVEDLIKVSSQMTVPWGVNIAVSPGISDHQEAAIDIRETASILLSSGLTPDWITLNVASPDTQDSIEMISEPLRVAGLVDCIKQELSDEDELPLWLKVGPGMSNERLAHLVEVALTHRVEALVCGNTFPDPRGGGWCGKAVQARSDSTLKWLKNFIGDHLPLVAAGGVMSGDDAQRKLDAGANAVQVVSALLVRGRDAASIIEREIPQ